MSDRTHLCLEALEESCLPDEERIRRIRAERWISYVRAEEVLVRMSELLEYPPRDRMPCLLLYGSTGMGKTKILRKFLRDHPSEPGRRKNSPRHPIISMQMPPEPDERSLYEEILSSLRVPVRSVSTSHLRPIVRDMLRYVGVRMLVVDEVHAMLASTYRKQRILLNTLRFLATDLRISLVCAGTHDAKRALTTDPQLADRFEAIELPPWKNNESLHRLLTSFQSLLPLRVRSDLVAPAMRRALLERTEGIMVRLVRLIETLAVDAIRNHTEKIDATSLHRLSTPPLLSMTESHSASDTSP